MTLLDLHWRFTVDDFHRLAELGIIPDGPLELIEGQITDGAGKPYRFTVEDCYTMAEAGILKRQDRVELIEGEMVEMSPIGSRHAAVVNRLMKQLVLQVGSQGIVSVQNPLRLGDRSLPEPDIVVLAPRADDYADSLPGPESVLLLIEVADSSLLYDARRKLSLYARAGIAEYWLADLVRSQIEVLRGPSGDSYSSQLTAYRDDEASPAALPQVTIHVADIFG